MEALDNLELLFRDAQRGNEHAVDVFFHEVLERISLAQGVDVSTLVDFTTWFRNNPDISKKGLAFSLFTAGFVASFYSKHGISIDQCSDANDIFAEIEYTDGVAMCAIVIGTNYRGMGNLELAIQHLTEAYSQLYKSGKIIHFVIASGLQLADLHVETGNYQDALAVCQEVWPLTMLAGNKRKIFDARLLNTMGGVYSKLGNNVLALQHFRKALEQSRELNQLPVTARILTDMGWYYLSVGEHAEAIAFNEQAMDIRQGLQLLNPMITNLINVTTIYEGQKCPDEAIKKLHEGLKYAEDLKVKMKLLQILKKLSALYEHKGDVVTSLAYYKRYNALLEEQNNELHEQKIKNIKLFVEAEQAMKQNEIIKAQKEEIEREKLRSDTLLLNILPAEVAEELKNSDSAEARYFNNVTVLFTDFIDFTAAVSRFTPRQLVSELHECFKAFDEITSKYEIEKIKTVGDAYMAVCGLPVENKTHAENVVRAAIEIRDFMKDRIDHLGERTFDVRIGINSGSVVAGIVGVKKFAYDIWGDTVNTAARMEQNSDAGKINISETTYNLIKDSFPCDCRGEIDVKGKGLLKMYYLSV